MTKEILAYTAGLFDGEGCVDIYKASVSKASKSPSFMLRVVITQKQGAIMNWLQYNFGGHVDLSRRNGNYIYRWDIRSQAAKNFLIIIQPYVLIKKEQVELAIQYEEQKGKYLETLKGKRGFRTLTEEEIKWRYLMQEKLSKLKTKYVLYIKNGAATTTE
jgi:hypothetical protein